MGSHCPAGRKQTRKMNNPTILRTRHKFGDYLSQPDIAKFELPKKMSRPWIVNNVYEKKQVCKRREWRASNPHDAIPVVADHVPGKEDDQKETKRDIEMEQQQMMNRVFNCPDLYTAAEPFTTMVQMMPVMVANQNGGFFVIQLPVQPLPQYVFHPQTSSFSCSSTCPSVSPPAADDGFVEGSDESADEMESLPEMDKLDLSQDLSMEEESDNDVDYEILDEDLERVVRSIIDEDD